MEPQALERSALEGKDREELQTIVVALGGKAPSRARKATLVDLVLELAGVTEPAADAGSSDADADADAPDEAASDQDAPDEGGSADQAAADEGRSADEAGSDDDRSSRRQGTGSGGRGRGSARGRNDRGGGGGGDERRSRAEPEPSGERTGDESSRDADGGGPDDGEPGNESGNRRRRRRGRDRDRGDDGYGFLRLNGFLPSREDVYVSVKQVRQFGLRKGDHVAGASRPASRSEKNPALLRIDAVNGDEPERNRDRPAFEDLTPLFPDERLRLEVADDPKDVTPRIIDLVSPIGKGQRGLIVAPPKAGKTTIMKQIARSIETNDPEVHLMVLLIDERPEEVTDFQRWMQRGEVIASTFDRPADEHTMVAELAIERAKRLVEGGKDVVVIVDGITRLVRAYNLSAPASGRMMSGGIDAAAIYPPKRFFGAARNVEEGGSLTILATALVETNSKMDEHIFEEFKGTGNMELKLDRRLAERRIYPAIDVDGSSTRHEELLFTRSELAEVWKLRRVLSGLAAEGGAGPGLEMLVERLASFPSNEAFLAEMGKAPG